MADKVVSERLTLTQLSQKDFFASWAGTRSPEIIARAKQIVLEAIQNMQLLDSDADYEDREEIIGDAVLRFNGLNEDNDNFIETPEREAICQQLLDIAEAAGIEPDEELLNDRDW